MCIRDRDGAIGKTRYFPWGIEDSSELTRKQQPIVHKITTVQNAIGVFAKIRDDSGSETQSTFFERDALGYLSRVSGNSQQDERKVWHDSLGRLEAQELPKIGRIFSNYDSRSQEISRLRISSDGKVSHTLRNTFDNQGRPVSNWIDGQLSVLKIYDRYSDTNLPAPHFAQSSSPLGLMTEVKTFDLAHGILDRSESMQYDIFGRIITHAVSLGSENFVEDYNYLADGSLHEMRNASGTIVSYGYDSSANFNRVSIQREGAVRKNLIENVEYNERKQIERVAFGAFDKGRLNTVLEYDPKTLHLIKIRSQFESPDLVRELQNIALDLDTEGRIVSIQDERSDKMGLERSAQYNHNGRNELIDADRYGVNTSYNYQIDGSFSSIDDKAMWSAETPDATVKVPYVFDSFQQLQSGPGIEKASFDGLGRLIALETVKDKILFGYDQESQRSYKRIVPKGAGRVRDFLYPSESLTVTPDGRESYVFAANERIAAIDEMSGAHVYYLHDNLGSIESVIDTKGNVVESMQYAPYGAQTTVASEKTRPALFGFTGHAMDTESGLIYMGFRFYDPRLGRFISPDPLYLYNPSGCESEPRECNLSIYALNDPINYVDPNGLSALGKTPKLTNTRAHISSNDDNDDTDSKFSSSSSHSATTSSAAAAHLTHSTTSATATSSSSVATSTTTRSENSVVFTGKNKETVKAKIYGKQETLDPNKIRFSQDSVSDLFTDGSPVDRLIKSLKIATKSDASVPPIKVFRKGKSIFTLDNRRLYAYQQAGRPIKVIGATLDEIRRDGPKKFSTQTKGLSIKVTKKWDG